MRDVAFSATPDGLVHGTLEYVTKVYDIDGQVVNSVVNRMVANLTKEKYQELQKQGLYVRQDVDAPAKGEYFLRIGMHDPASDRVGALEVPLAAIQPPAAVPTGK
jgi:hypothetical protein